VNEFEQQIDELKRMNHPVGKVRVAFSGPALLIGPTDPTLPYGVIRNGDGRLFDILYPHERAARPLPDGFIVENPQ